MRQVATGAGSKLSPPARVRAGGALAAAAPPLKGPAKRRDGTLNSTVYEAIKAQIFANRLKQGSKLTNEDLAAMLGVSRTPVREALERLCQEGFVLRVPNRGYYVAEIDADEVKELFDVREALELYALRRTMSTGLTAPQIRQLEKTNREYANLIRDDRTRERLMADRNFHLTLASFAGNKVLMRSLEAAFERLVLKLRIDGYATRRGRTGYKEHCSLMGALKLNDLPAAELALAGHIRGACRRVLSHLESLNGLNGEGGLLSWKAPPR